MIDLVLVPGLGSDAAVWSPTIAVLGDRARCRVGDTLHDDSLAGMARRILADAPPIFVLAGVSMGGMVALEMIRATPERIAALAIVDSNAFSDTPTQAEQRRQGIAAIRSGMDFRAAAEASLAWVVHRDASASVRKEIVEMGVRVGAEAYARQSEAVLNRPDQAGLLDTIRVPTLIATGADDAMIPVSVAHAMADRVPGAEVALIPDCGHLPPIEAPQAMADLLGALIARVPAAARAG